VRSEQENQFLPVEGFEILDMDPKQTVLPFNKKFYLADRLIFSNATEEASKNCARFKDLTNEDDPVVRPPPVKKLVCVYGKKYLW
jgi:hypothetical protein